MLARLLCRLVDRESETRLDLDDLFPVKGAIPESQQIGRDEAIQAVVQRLVAGEDILVIEPRRVGKSSTIGYGALPHVRDEYGGVVASVDLRQAGVRDAGSLADELVRSAMRTGAGTAVQKEQAKRIARLTKRLVTSERSKAAATLAGDGSTAQTVHALAALVAGGAPGIDRLHQVLEALEAEAAEHGRPVVVFIDEAQDITSRWRDVNEASDVQRELERMMRKPGRLVTYAFAGSERSAMEGLFATGQPLHFQGDRYQLPPIASNDWHAGIAERFVRDGRRIEREQVDEILAATEGQPLRTMQVCRQALRVARTQDAPTISSSIVADAVSQARAHPSWDQAEA